MMMMPCVEHADKEISFPISKKDNLLLKEKKKEKKKDVKQSAASRCSPGLRRTGKQPVESRLCFCCQGSVWIRGL